MSAPDAGSPIEDYLDELVVALAARPPRELRGLLAEAEAHLRDAAEAGVGSGLAPRQAEQQAVARFGSAASLVRAEQRRTRPSLRRIVWDLLPGASLLVGIGSVAIGLSGVIAAVIRLVAGPRAVVDVTPGQVLGRADCARWQGLYSGARTCRDAAVADWATETVVYRVVVGLLGVLVLLGYRHWLRQRTVLPQLAAVRDAVGMTAFSIAGVWTLALGIDRAVNGGGPGQWLSAAPVALASAAAFAVLLAHDLGVAGQPS